MPNYLRTAEVLERVPVSEDTLKRWRRRTRREGRQVGPPFIKVEGVVLYDEDDLQQWIDRNRTVVA